jgi:CPA2 family monovalent cation:H+ antiporter-2
VTALKVTAFIALMLLVGAQGHPDGAALRGAYRLARAVPPAVLAIALGVAFGAAVVFGVSLRARRLLRRHGAGANRSSASRRREETLPLRDAFAVLFFVSVGMLFNPVNLIERPLPLIATFLIIVVGKSLAAYLIVKAFGYPRIDRAGHCGEPRPDRRILLHPRRARRRARPAAGRSVAIWSWRARFSILVNPLLFMAVDHYGARLDAAAAQEPDGSTAAVPQPEEAAEDVPEPTALIEHAIVVGYGRVGKRIVERLRAAGMPVLVIEERAGVAEALRESGIEAIGEPAGGRGVLLQANIAGARWFVTAIPDAFAAGTLIEQARAANGAIRIVARAASGAEADHLRQFGANHIVIAKEEVAAAMADRLLSGEARPAREEDGVQGELNLAAPSSL